MTRRKLLDNMLNHNTNKAGDGLFWTDESPANRWIRPAIIEVPRFDHSNQMATHNNERGSVDAADESAANKLRPRRRTGIPDAGRQLVSLPSRQPASSRYRKAPGAQIVHTWSVLPLHPSAKPGNSISTQKLCWHECALNIRANNREPEVVKSGSEHSVAK